MSKVYMRLEEFNNTSKKRPYIFIGKDRYKEYQGVLLGAGYKPWAKDKRIKLAKHFVPQSWIGVEVDDKLVGVCSAQFGAVKVTSAVFSARIAVLAVLPKHEGKGIASFLVAQVIENLIKAGYEKIYVAVKPENKGAVKVYEKVGFVGMK